MTLAGVVARVLKVDSGAGRLSLGLKPSYFEDLRQGRIAGWLGLDRLGAYLRLNGLSVLHLADGSVIFRPLGREVLPASS